MLVRVALQIIQRGIEYRHNGKIFRQFVKAGNQFVHAQVAERTGCKAEEREHERSVFQAVEIKGAAIQCWQWDMNYSVAGFPYHNDHQ